MIRDEKEKHILPDNIEAVLFDLDGTLVDSMWMWPQIDRDFLHDRGFEVPEGLKADVDGLSMAEDAVYFKTRFNLPDSCEELIDIWNNMALHHYEEDVHLQPGAKEFLDFLRRKGIRAAVVTSNSRVLCDAALRSNGIEDYFGAIVTSEDVSHGKPDPEGYLMAAGRLHADPHSCIVFEDLPAGLTAAQAAGMTAIAFEDEYSHAYIDEKQDLCDFMIDDYRDMIG